MYPRCLLLPAIAGCIAPAALAQTADYRIVELTGQTQVTAADHILDFAVQVKITSTNNSALGTGGFNIRIVGESESAGTLSRAIISNSDGTYSSTLGANSSIGIGGLARQYAYLAGLSAQFNGLINSSAGTFTNGPDQEIGNVAAAAVGSWLLGTPGLDTDADGNPDNWSGNGSGDAPPVGTTVPIDPLISFNYFARNKYIDIYHFRYNVSDLSTRTLHFTLEDLAAGAFTRLSYQSGTWGPQTAGLFANQITASSLDIAVPSPAAPILLIAAAAIPLRRNRPRR